MLTMMKRGALIVPSFPQNAKQESQLTQSVFTKAHNAPQKKKNNAFTIWNRTWVLHVMERPRLCGFWSSTLIHIAWEKISRFHRLFLKKGPLIFISVESYF